MSLRSLKSFVLVTASIALAIGAFAQPTSYARKTTKINVGMLLIDSTSGPGGVPTNADPYVFYNLERRADIKPAGWEFDNPLASGTITPQIQARWDAIYAGLGLGPGPFVTGQRLTKNMAAYWEVVLSQISPQAISLYDVLIVHAPGNIWINPIDRSKLQAFLDSGGVLWFDKSTSQTVDAFRAFPIPFLTTNAGANPVATQPEHPLFNYPHKIHAGTAARLGSHNGNHAILPATLAGYGLAGYQNIVSTLFPDYTRINPVVVNSAGIVTGVAQVGNGLMIVTSGNVTSPINEPTGGTNLGGLGRNSGPIGGENFRNIPINELKFAYNVLALAAGHQALSKGSRRLNSSFDDLGAPLLETWSDTSLDLSQTNETNYVPPAIYKGLVFVTAGDRVYAYKTDPNRDLDGDGLTDDGFPDYSYGVGRDLVWHSTPLQAPLSSPVCAEVADPAANVPSDQVYVIDGAGRLHVFNALPKAAGILLGPNPIPPVQTINAPGAAPIIDLSQDNRGPYAPTFMEGLVYVYDMYSGGFGQRLGRVWVVNASALTLMQTGATPWALQGPGSPNLAEPGGASTIGYIPTDDNPGGLDKVMYVTNRSTLTGAPVGVSSLWMGAKGESPTVLKTPTSVNIITRAASKGLTLYLPGFESSYGIRIRLVDATTGEELPAAAFASYFTGAVIQFAPGQLQCALSQPIPDTIGIRIDYHIDWGTGAANIVSSVIRGQIFLPDDIQRRRYMQKSMALSPRGNLFVVTSNEQNNGTLFCLREFSRGQYELVYRWDLHDGFTVAINNTQRVTVPSAIEDRDDLWRLLFPGPNPYPRLRRLHFHGSPVIRGDVLFLNVSADQQFGFFSTRATYLLAFDAAPSRIDIRLGEALPAGLRVRQPDIARSTNKSNPEQFNLLQTNQADSEASSGVIRFRNMMSSTGGQMQNAFSTSMPIIVGGSGVPERLIDPNATGSRWSPLLWYFGISGFITDAPPMVMGSTIYQAGASTLPSLINGTFPPVPLAAMFAMDTNISPNDDSIITVQGQPGLKQSRWLIEDLSAPGGFRSNPHVRWPSGEGIQNLGDFRVRLLQTLIGEGIADQGLGVIGGDGTLVAWANRGIYAFRPAYTVIADEGRIVEVDSAGFVRWTSDLSYNIQRGPTDTVVQASKLERPTKVYKSSENEYVVVDTGADRVVVIDKGAGELRSIDRISLDLTFRPQGWLEGSAIQLRQPRDVSVWGDFVFPAANPFTGPPPTGMEYWVHYVIADTGNQRLIEVVDRYRTTIDANGNPVVGAPVRDAAGFNQFAKLVWHTPLDLSGKGWQYTAVQRFQVGVDALGNPLFVFIAGIGDAMPTRVSSGLDTPNAAGDRQAGGGPGGLLVFDAVSGQGNQVINDIVLPDGSRKRLFGINSVAVRPISLRAVVQNPNLLDYAVMITDATGVYEVRQVGANWQVIWMMSNAVYENIRGVRLRAVSAKRLTNGQVLMTNGFYGSTISGAPFYGEVVQWRDDYDPLLPNLGFSINSVRAELPPIVGTRGLRVPQFADRF